MDKKLLFFDIDNTLVHHDGDRSYIPQSTVETLKALETEGHRLAIATGRGYFQMKYVMDLLEIHDAVCFNGHQNIIDHQVVDSTYLEHESLMKLVNRQRRRIFPFVLVDAEAVYIKDFFGRVKSGFEREMNILEGTQEQQPFGELKSFAKLDKQYHSMMIFERNFKRAADYPAFSFNKWGKLGYDVGMKGVTKLSGVKWMAKQLGYSSEDIFVFGDGYNDIEMLSGIKNSIAMGNGVKEAKKVASYVTSNIEADGIKEACHHFGLIGEKYDSSL